VVTKFGWAREWLTGRLVGLACQDEDGAFVGVRALRAFSGEAELRRTVGPRARLTRTYDLSFKLEWQAKLREELYAGTLAFSEVSSASEPSEYEVSATFDGGPADGSEAQRALIGLLGPLRVGPALAAEGRLTQQIWRDLLDFRTQFGQLDE